MQNKLKDPTKDLTKEEIFDIIKLYINENISLSLREMRDKDNFTLPAWSEYQAYQLGMQKAFNKLLDFLP